MACKVCGGERKIRLPFHDRLLPNAYEADEVAQSARAEYGTYDCPQCVPMVPYRRVRAKKITAAVDAVDFGKFQVPIQRQLAQKFGEFLLREGLIWFTSDNLDDGPGSWRQTIEVTARCNVVDRTGGEVSGAEARMEVAEAEVTAPRKILNEIERRKLGLPVRAEVVFTPERDFVRRKPKTKRDIMAAQREDAEAMADRFSGLELDGDFDD